MNDRQNSNDISVLQTKIDALQRELKDVHKKTDHLNDMANRWKGGFFVILGLGGIIGYLTDKILDLLPKGH